MQRFHLTREVLLGVENLMLHKLRSLLTMLGMVFGVGSVIAMLSVGEGASKKALEQIRKLGSNNIIINSMKAIEDEGASQTRSFMSIYGLLYADAERMAGTFTTVRRVVPVKLIRKECRIKDNVLELRIVGTTPAWFDLVRRPVIAGRVLLPGDMHRRTNATVLTEFGARRLLAKENTIGQVILIGGDRFEVVGIVKSEGGESGGIQTPDQEVDAYIALGVARERFGDVFSRRTAGTRIRELVELHQIIVEVDDIANVESTSEGIERMLDSFHKKKDYRLSVPLALLRQAEATKRTFNIVLGSIACISLLVGGIGIMNIMLASVTERTREIGIRRAIGAKQKQIITQFLIETIVLSSVGGLIGIGIGMLIPLLITHFSDMPTVVTWWSIVLSLGISVGIGIVFGIYPAVRAAKLDPIVALRHE